MDRLDKEILKAVLFGDKSMYGLEKYLKENGVKSNYATVWRHIKRMQKENLLSITKSRRKNGRYDRRRTERPVFTSKGLATLLINGDLQKEELKHLGLKLLEKEELKDLPKPLLRILPVEDVFDSIVSKIRPRVNLEFFDEKYFDELFWTSFIEVAIEELPKIKFKGNKETILKGLEALPKIAQRTGIDENIFKNFVELGKMLGVKNKKKGE